MAYRMTLNCISSCRLNRIKTTLSFCPLHRSLVSRAIPATLYNPRCFSTSLSLSSPSYQETNLIDEYLPQELVSGLDEHIIGQHEAKRSLAVVLRDRWRRQRIKDPKLRAETTPSNILLIGPSGCGKTELARRIAQITNAPFTKVVATKFTEVGFVGDDTHSMVNDLAEQAYLDEKRRYKAKAQNEARRLAENHLITVLSQMPNFDHMDSQTLLEQLRCGALDDILVEIDCDLLNASSDKSGNNPFHQILNSLNGNATGQTSSGASQPGLFSAFPVHLVLSKLPPVGQASTFLKKMDLLDVEGKSESSNKPALRQISVKNALPLLEEHFICEMIDEEEVIASAKDNAENRGIIFIDEFDKLIDSKVEGNEFRSKSRGVQKELLSLMDGTYVNTTRLGRISTEFILFVASGAFHASKPSDIMPELQGRLPIRSELQPLTIEDLKRILLETKYSLLKQQIALLETEGIFLSFTPEAISTIAQLTYELNAMSANIGARRLKTVFSKLLEEIKFDVQTYKDKHVTVDADMVQSRLKSLLTHTDLSKYII